jgi:RNA recognition motif-containing protein
VAVDRSTRNARGSGMNIYVGNLPYNLTEDELKAAFSQFGEVSSASIIMDKMSGQSKGFGFVEMPENSEADEAIKALNESALNGRNIKVNQARPRGERSPRRPRY